MDEKYGSDHTKRFKLFQKDKRGKGFHNRTKRKEQPFLPKVSQLFNKIDIRTNCGKIFFITADENQNIIILELNQSTVALSKTEIVYTDGTFN